MLMPKERQAIVEYGKRMSSSGLTNGTSGNLSAYHPATGLMAISPSGIGYFETKAEDIVIMTLDGQIVEGDCVPSSEHDLHATIYKKYPQARGVVHAHSKYCTTFACMNEPIRAAHYLIAGAETSVVPVVPYALFGSTELAEKVKEADVEGLAFLLANHGMVAYGPSLSRAFNVAENVEWVAEIQWRAMCVGRLNHLNDGQIKEVVDKFRTYGQPAKEPSGNGY